MKLNNEQTVEIIIEESLGLDRFREPVTAGIPFPKGLLKDRNSLTLIGKKNKPIPLQAETLAVWPDQSIKWLLLDFEADGSAKSALSYFLHVDSSLSEKPVHSEGIKMSDDDSCITVNTGKALFVMDKKIFLPFKSIKLRGDEILDVRSSCIILKDENQDVLIPSIENMHVETAGALRSSIRAEGHFKSAAHKVFCDFSVRLHFYAGKSLVKMEFTIRNPKAAKHSGGLWDLGDEGSVYFKELSFDFALSDEKDISIFWKPGIHKTVKALRGHNIEIYQDSSGGEHWDSPNHVNRQGKVANKFRGYRITADVLLEEGHRATPVLTVTSGVKSITATIQEFWQNFPKAVEADKNILKLKVFPGQYDDLFELQGGEQKTHTIYVQFNTDADGPVNMDWVHEPLVCRNTPEWYAESMALGYMSPQCRDRNPAYQALLDNVIKGPDSFFELRERIDEYGWRNFGDVYASHEIVFYKGMLSPFVSHYNNQYDIINGCLLQFARTGDRRWYQIMEDLARHITDIDIYHTKEDRPAYNGGHFWHTDHFMHAETSTHRSYSRRNIGLNGMESYGGGPSPEHCYTTGLTNYYYLTGSIMAKEAVIGLADWLMNKDRTEISLKGILRKAKQKISHVLNDYSNAPGRGEANSINTLIDAFELTEERKYLLKAESIIRKFISPSDDINKLNQQQMELRWFYLIFLQSVGKYLDIKNNRNERDKMYDYAKASLLYHAEWMLQNEALYKQMFHVVEIPSSTWPAHDIRKSAVFDYACKYADNHKKGEFKAKAEYFYNKSIEDVLSFNDESRTFVRPLAVLMHYGVMHTYFQNKCDVNGGASEKN